MNNVTPFTPSEQYADPNERKRMFANAYLRFGDYQKAAEQIEPDQLKAQRLGMEWSQDPYVLECIGKERVTNGAASEIPTCEELAVEILKATRQCKALNKDKLAGYALAAKMLGYIDSKDNSGGTNVTFNRVFVVPAPAASLDDFERMATAQQTRLLNAAI